MKEKRKSGKKTKKSGHKTTSSKSLDKLKEENEMLKLQLAAREKEREEYKKELDDIHESVSYRVGRRIAETKIGGWLKKRLRK